LTAADAQVREVRADPVAMADLVQWLGNRRFAALRGVIWYRLPLVEDRLSWNERTWQSVIQGRTPTANTELTLEKSAAGLVEIAVQANGDADSVLDNPVKLGWRRARLIAADGLAGFTAVRAAPDTLRLQPPPQPLRLTPGQRVLIAWLRFDQPPEIMAHVDSSPAR
jgi:hypothetical protein